MKLGFVQLKRPLYDPATCSMAKARDVFSVDDGYSLQIEGHMLRVTHGGTTAVCPVVDIAHGRELGFADAPAPAPEPAPAPKAKAKAK